MEKKRPIHRESANTKGIKSVELCLVGESQEETKKPQSCTRFESKTPK